MVHAIAAQLSSVLSSVNVPSTCNNVKCILFHQDVPCHQTALDRMSGPDVRMIFLSNLSHLADALSRRHTSSGSLLSSFRVIAFTFCHNTEGTQSGKQTAPQSVPTVTACGTSHHATACESTCWDEPAKPKQKNMPGFPKGRKHVYVTTNSESVQTGEAKKPHLPGQVRRVPRSTHCPQTRHRINDTMSANSLHGNHNPHQKNCEFSGCNEESPQVLTPTHVRYTPQPLQQKPYHFLYTFPTWKRSSLCTHLANPARH